LLVVAFGRGNELRHIPIEGAKLSDLSVLHGDHLDHRKIHHGAGRTRSSDEPADDYNGTVLFKEVRLLNIHLVEVSAHRKRPFLVALKADVVAAKRQVWGLMKHDIRVERRAHGVEASACVSASCLHVVLFGFVEALQYLSWCICRVR